MNTTRSKSRSRRIGMRTAVLALAFAALGPSHAWAQTEAPQQTPATAVAKRKRADAKLVVESFNWLDAHLYLVRDGMLTSLGFVNGPGKTEITLPSMAVAAGSDVRVLVLPIGGTQTYLSPTLVINPGDEVQMTIENDLDLSTAAVFPGG
ncbi:MAG TPA: hypothetical protein VJ997_07865 [Longimicrobiales bacterium]|nr:hypothetical protein [Longimicrobiales bacterium]